MLGASESSMIPQREYSKTSGRKKEQNEPGEIPSTDECYESDRQLVEEFVLENRRVREQ